MEGQKPPRLLIWISIAVMLAAAIITMQLHRLVLGPAIDIDISHQPTIGNPNAPLHIVVFAEPKCIDCKKYHLGVYPTIKKEYIDTNQATYTVILVSFLPGSAKAADALLCAYYQDPDAPNPKLYYAFLEHLYKNQPDEQKDWVTDDLLIQFAKESCAVIQLDQLKSCIDTEKYHNEVSQNTRYARKIMGGRISTPSVYVNGVKLNDLSLIGTRKLIQATLKQKQKEPKPS